MSKREFTVGLTLEPDEDRLAEKAFDYIFEKILVRLESESIKKSDLSKVANLVTTNNMTASEVCR